MYPGLKYARVFYSMKKIIFLLLILMIAGAPLSEELSFKLGEWNYIELNIPEGRLGGGDYYNVSVKSQSGA